MRPIHLPIAAALSAIALSVSPALADPESDARALFDQTYGVAVRGVKTTRSSEDDGKLGIILLEAAQKNEGTNAYRIVLLEQAYEYGRLHTISMRAAADALQELARLVPRRQLESQEKLLVLYEIVFRNAASKSNKEVHKKAGAATTDLIVEIAQAKAKRAEYAAALSQLTKATGISRSVGYGDRAADIKKMIDEMTPLAPIDVRVQAAKRALGRDPADKDAAKTITDLYLKDLDRPLTAKTYAEIVLDAKTVEHFAQAGKPVDDLSADEARALGKWYESLAGDGSATAKTNMLVRAKVYYQRVLEAKAGDAEAQAALAKVDLTLTAMKIDAEKVDAMVKSRRERLAIVAAVRPKPVEPPKVDPPKVDPPQPVAPPKVNPKPVDPPKVDPPKVVEPDPEKVEPEFREEELDDAYWKKRKSIFDFGM